MLLYAEKHTIEKRLDKRLEESNSWGRTKIECCIEAFNSSITEIKIITDNRSVESIVEEIAQTSGLILVPDNRNCLRKYIDRMITTIKHIR